MMVKAPADVEFSIPEPVSANVAPPFGTSARRLVRPAHLLLSAILPGSGHIMRGEWTIGMALALTWGLLLATTFLAWNRVVGFFSGGRISVDGALSVVVLLLMLAGIWAWSFYDLKVR